MSRNREIADITQKDQTIAGIKTFSSSPIVPTPTNGDNSTKVATTAFVLANASTTPSASETVAGKVELATNAEVVTGTDTVRAVTPAGMKAGLNASGTAPIYACRAWVNFNGTGTVAIRASGNVSSITDNGIGDYTVNFTTAMFDANYVLGITGDSGVSVVNDFSSIATVRQIWSPIATRLSSSIRIVTGAQDSNGGGGKEDFPLLSLVIFR